MQSVVGRVRALAVSAPLFLVPLLGACAGSTVGSGVGDQTIRQPPYYAGRLLPAGGATIAVLPIGVQRGASQPAMFEPDADEGSPLAALLAEMNAYVSTLDIGAMVPIDAALPGTAPDVIFRCQSDEFDDCAFPADGTDPEMRLAVARPDGRWVTALGSVLDDAGADHALVLRLEFSDYWAYQRNLRGSKEVRLGSNHIVDVPWLTSLETPVNVLQLTGAIVNREGKAVRIGAEGMVASRTPILLSAIGGQQLLGDDDVEALRTARRSDLPGEPLVWQAALRELLAGLTGRTELRTPNAGG